MANYKIATYEDAWEIGNGDSLGLSKPSEYTSTPKKCFAYDSDDTLDDFNVKFVDSPTKTYTAKSSNMQLIRETDLTKGDYSTTTYYYYYLKNSGSDSGTMLALTYYEPDELTNDPVSTGNIVVSEDITNLQDIICINSTSNTTLVYGVSTLTHDIFYIRAIIPIDIGESNVYTVKTSITVIVYMSNDSDISTSDYDKKVTFSNSSTLKYYTSEYAYIDIEMDLSSYEGSYKYYLFVVTATVDSSYISG